MTHLIDQLLAGDPRAWPQLVAAVHPRVVAMCQRRRLSRDPEVAREVAARTLDRLRANDHAALHGFVRTQKKYPAMTFDHWLGAVVRNVCVDALRSMPEYQRRRLASERRLVAVDVRSLDEEAHAATGGDIEDRIDMRRMLGFLLSEEFPEIQRRAIAMWLEGRTNEEISDQLGLGGPADSLRLLNAARQRMRRRFPRKTAVGVS